MADATRPRRDARRLRGEGGRDPLIDPSPAHQAIEEVCAEYERRIAELEAERDDLQHRLEEKV